MALLRSVLCDGAQRLSALTGLRHLGVSGTVAGGDALVALTAALPALRHLEARNAQLTDANLRALPQVRRAQTSVANGVHRFELR